MTDKMDIKEICGAMLGKVEPLEETEIKKRLDEIENDKRREHIRKQEELIKAPHWWTIGNFRFADWPELGSVLEKICASPANRHSLLLAAPTNSGKSHALVALARKLIGEFADDGGTERDQWRYMTAYRVKEHELYPLWDTIRYKNSHEYEDVIRQTKNADILVYEDLGKVALTHNDGFSLTPFGCVVFSIFDFRAETRKINLVSSRYSDPDMLQKAVGVDTMRRILQGERDEYRARILLKGEYRQ